ncbi:MAG: 2-C-methyl-D-erythritol 4-phosphate cytidylyltransferase [Elusimicrobiales bacterium]
MNTANDASGAPPSKTARSAAAKPAAAKRGGWAAIIAAGGSGARMGRPKQMLPLGGKPLLFHSISLFAGMQEFGEIIAVTAPENFPAVEREFGPAVKLAAAGATRLQSVKNGFALVPQSAEVVAVHDGARPLASAALARAVCAGALQSGAAVAAVPVKDTIKISEDGKTVLSTPDRAQLWAAHTPQCYRRDVLAEMFSRFPDAGDVSDESQLAERAGFDVALVPSAYENIKITTPDDIAVAEALMKNERCSEMPRVRVGMGYDMHRLVAGRPLILGGLAIAHGKGLLGHSDGDAVLHAVCDAALGAMAAGEIGIYFPPTDLTIMGISSKAIAEKTLEVLASMNASLSQIDVTVVAEEPKLMPHYGAVRKSLSEIFRLPLESVSFKAKSAEGLGPVGRGEAVECHAVALVTAR